jgi:general bacterial porin, GBP family
MKKSLIALAAMASVAGVAQAQSSVTLYGVFDGGVANTATTTAAGVKANNTTQGAVNNATSVIGLQGSEDLGGGLKAVFQLEGHLNTANGQVGSRAQNTSSGTLTNQAGYDALFNRQAWLGLSDAKLGTLKFGRTADVVDSYEGYSNFSQAFDTEAAAANGIGGKNANTVRYDSPVIAGVSIAASYSNDAGGISSSGALENNKNKVTTYGLNYVNGKITAGAASGKANASDSTNEGKIDTLYAGYNFGFADVRVQNTKDKTAAGVTVKTKEIAAAIPVPQLKGVSVIAHYEDADTSVTDGTTTTVDYKQTGLAVVKELSKRTSLYAVYRDKNRDNGTDEVVTAVGVTHKF